MQPGETGFWPPPNEAQRGPVELGVTVAYDVEMVRRLSNCRMLSASVRNPRNPRSGGSFGRLSEVFPVGPRHPTGGRLRRLLQRSLTNIVVQWRSGLT